ncbi:hypothetical protein [Marinibactrum halimedae]|uniref:Uncharacterized protein n=1 Tax=Marinibactrum halimedae TaxID=1444977 RepID=A0AA37T7N8_9GAMM|nr:hypothetical protein [Marinibactrum halimedae]MCD9458199.1 hypothetical protein [Marinibactrum halimedae]GLS27174.1 hypothetical protein GCM10007877_28930 [Marinibactrum halimedae]
MRNLIKYSPFCFREQTSPITPIGPGMEFSFNRTFNLGENKCQIKLPLHYAKHSSYSRLCTVGPEKNGQPYIESNSNKPFVNHNYAYQKWGFFGPWFTGEMARLHFNLDIYQPTKLHENISLFHPRAFEHTLAHYLADKWGKAEEDDKTRALYKGPTNWTPYSNFPVPCARFNIEPNVAYTTLIHELVFPISNNFICSIWFRFGLKNIELPENEKIYDTDIWRLIEDIINSIDFKLQGESLKQFEAVKAQCPDMSLTKEFAPLNFPMHPDDWLKQTGAAADLLEHSEEQN